MRRYARLHNTSYTGAIKLAVSNALRTDGEIPEESEGDRRTRAFRAAVREARAAYRAMPTLDSRDPDDILYDGDGVPR